jgi:hypothetical protein
LRPEADEGSWEGWGERAAVGTAEDEGVVEGKEPNDGEAVGEGVGEVPNDGEAEGDATGDAEAEGEGDAWP